MDCTPLKLAAEAGLRLADSDRPELGWRSFALDRIRQSQTKQAKTPEAASRAISADALRGAR
jgi:predicted DNA-binding transcriptional regulator YafY